MKITHIYARNIYRNYFAEGCGRQIPILSTIKFGSWDRISVRWYQVNKPNSRTEMGLLSRKYICPPPRDVGQRTLEQ